MKKTKKYFADVFNDRRDALIKKLEQDGYPIWKLDVVKEKPMNKFRWSMTENDYTRMQKMVKEHKVPSNNVFGGVAIGSILFEWIGEEDCADHDYHYVNCFEAGVDAGYGNLDDGTPYDCIDHHLPYVTTLLTYNGFKKIIEEEIIKMAEHDKKFKEKIEKDMKPKWYGF